MGIVSSKAKAIPEAGPGLTFSEKSAVDDTTLEAWLKQLDERSNPIRLNVAHFLSVTVYASEDMATSFEYLGEHFLMICNNNRQRVAKMLQTPFLNGETTITWTICHLPAHLLHHTLFNRIPPVLAVQLRFIPSWEKNANLTESMSTACCTTNANRLFQLLNPYRKSKSANSLVYSLSIANANPRRFDFTINDFPMHMVVDGRIDLRFICESRLYSIGFLIGSKGQWSFFYNVVQDQSVTKKYTREIHVDLETSNGGEKPSVFKAKVSSSDWMSGEWIGGDASMLKNANEFVGRDRVLKGHIRIVDC